MSVWPCVIDVNKTDDQLDAIIKIQLSSNQLNMFRAILCPSSGAQDCDLQHVVQRLSRFQWPRGLRRRSAATRLLRSWVRIPPGAWMFVCCECCVLSGRGLCDELIACPGESYWVWWVVVCDQKTSSMRRPLPALGRSATGKKRVMSPDCCSNNILQTKHVVLGAALKACDRQQFGDVVPHAVNHNLALLMMGKELPETCWADLKINKFLFLHLVGHLLNILAPELCFFLNFSPLYIKCE